MVGCQKFFLNSHRGWQGQHAHLVSYVPGWCVTGMLQAALPVGLTSQAAPAGHMRMHNKVNRFVAGGSHVSVICHRIVRHRKCAAHEFLARGMYKGRHRLAWHALRVTNPNTTPVLPVCSTAASGGVVGNTAWPGCCAGGRRHTAAGCVPGSSCAAAAWLQLQHPSGPA